MVELENAEINIYFVIEREKIYLELRPIKYRPEGEVVTLDLLHEKLTGCSIDTAILTDELIKFFRDSFNAVFSLFSENESNELLTIFNKMKKNRSKRLFGYLVRLS